MFKKIGSGGGRIVVAKRSLRNWKDVRESGLSVY